jgi:hypothetical protein
MGQKGPMTFYTISSALYSSEEFMSTDSPRHLQSNALKHLVESHVGSSRDAIKADLVGKN